MLKLLTLAMAIYLIFSLAACVSRAAPKTGSTTPSAEVVDADYSPDSPVVDAQFAHVPETGEEAPRLLVLIDGQLYCATGQDSDIDGRCGMMDGRIDSSVERGQIPGQNGQSNFGAPYGYQYGADGQIEVNLEDRWLVFAPVRSPEENS
ncbi:MAG: hypothetical protein ACI4O0_06240 [Candidatus Limivicinus sp.]